MRDAEQNAHEACAKQGKQAVILDEQPPALRVAAAEAIRAALEPYQNGNRVPLRGAIWIVRAVSPGSRATQN